MFFLLNFQIAEVNEKHKPFIHSMNINGEVANDVLMELFYQQF